MWPKPGLKSYFQKLHFVSVKLSDDLVVGSLRWMKRLCFNYPGSQVRQSHYAFWPSDFASNPRLDFSHVTVLGSKAYFHVKRFSAQGLLLILDTVCAGPR